jgi:hypothetical protein
MTKTCFRCGIEFPRKPRTGNRDWSIAKYCSQACSLATWKERSSAPSPMRADLATLASVDYPRLKQPGRCCAHKDGRVKEHRLIAELAVGRCLKGHPVHHLDGNPRNNQHTNLVVCENQSYHKLLHTRTRILGLGGNPDTQKICHVCKQLLPRTAFGKSRSESDGLRGVCSPCNVKNASKYQKSRRRFIPEMEFDKDELRPMSSSTEGE